MVGEGLEGTDDFTGDWSVVKKIGVVYVIPSFTSGNDPRGAS